MISFTDAVKQLHAKANPKKAAEMKNSIKIDRVYLGISNQELNNTYKGWRASTSTDDRIRLAADLWDSNIYEARIVAAKLLTQARIKNDELVWEEIVRWIPKLDHQTIADQVCSAGSRRLKENPTRLNQVSNWVKDENIWMRQSVLTLTMQWTKLNNPKIAELRQRNQILSWAGELSNDKEWLIQKALANWLSSLSKHDTPAVLLFLETHGAKM
ncbi:DNA alkylation repair protein, partial [Amylibacter sp.]|nr:DNA alkylation repair protein [Amylibacter sp.]